MPSPLVLHIPHSSATIPEEHRALILLDDEALARELHCLTDWFTDDLFDVPWCEKVLFPTSRLLLDPERFTDDANEVMASRGAGVVYTHTTSGGRLRNTPSPAYRQALIRDYYTPHHARLSWAVDEALVAHGGCLLIDCHSFPSVPLPYELDQTSDRQTICLGTDQFHTPAWLAETAADAFEACGMMVTINRPFSGTLVPSKHFGRDTRVLACMVEVNRAAYMDEVTGLKSASYPAVKATIHQVIGLLGEAWKNHH